MLDRPDPISIVVAIPTLNEEVAIESVIRHMATEREYFPNLQIVVGDGGSTDKTTSIVARLTEEFDFLYLLDNPKKIQSAALNLIAREWADKAEVLIRCDAHAIYPERFIQRLVHTLSQTGADSVVLPMDSVGRSVIQKAIAWASDSSIGSGGSAHRGGKKSGFVDHGHHAAFRMRSYLSINGYDETFSQNEDAEFDCRLRENGGKIYLDAETRIKYLPRTNFSKLWKQYYLYGVGRSRTVLKHPGSLRVRQLAVPLHVLAVAASVLLFTVTLKFFFLLWPFVYLAVLCLSSINAARKHRSSVGLLTGIAALVMHTSWGLGFITGGLANIWKRGALTPTGRHSPA